MSKIPLAATLLGALLLAGCGHFEWRPRPGVQNAPHLDSTLSRCQFEAAGSPARIVNGGYMTSGSLEEMCMNGAGYAKIFVRG